MTAARRGQDHLFQHEHGSKWSCSCRATAPTEIHLKKEIQNTTFFICLFSHCMSVVKGFNMVKK